MSVATRVGASWAIVEVSNFRDILRGQTNVTVYEGDVIGINEVVNSLQYYERLELSTADAPKLRLTVYSPDLAEAPVFELITNQKEKDIYEDKAFTSVSNDDVMRIQKFIKNPVPGSSPPITGGGAAVTLWQHLLRGTKKSFDWDYVLKYTLSISSAAALNLSYANVKRTHSTAQMQAAIPGGLPAGIVQAIGTIPNETAPTDFAFGWLKTPPDTRQTQLGRVVITGEWWLSLWSSTLYPPLPIV